MASTAEALIAAAEKDLGYREGRTTKFGIWYASLPGNAGKGFESGAWCDMAVSKWSHDSGNGDVVGCHAYVPYHINWFKQQGGWHPGASGARRGDIIMFDWNADNVADHVGIVLASDGAGVHCIEGNTAGSPDRVAHQTRHPSQIEGYGRPRYAGAPAAGHTHPVVRKGDAGPGVARAQWRLNVHGARPVLTADGQFGQLTYDVTVTFQKARKLAPDGVIGPATWALLHPDPPKPAAKPGGPYHGEWVSAGQLSLHALCNGTLKYPVNTVLRMTATHFGSFNPVLAAYVGGVLAGTVKPTDRLPKGAVLWVD